MVLAKRKVVSALLGKGFSQKKKGHHIVVLVYRKLDGGLSRIRTHVSHGSRPKDLNDHLIGQMARQTKLSRENFGRLTSCSMGQSEYEKTIRDNL